MSCIISVETVKDIRNIMSNARIVTPVLWSIVGMDERRRITWEETLKALNVPLTSAPFEWATAGQCD